MELLNNPVTMIIMGLIIVLVGLYLHGYIQWRLEESKAPDCSCAWVLNKRILEGLSDHFRYTPDKLKVVDVNELRRISIKGYQATLFRTGEVHLQIGNYCSGVCTEHRTEVRSLIEELVAIRESLVKEKHGYDT